MESHHHQPGRRSPGLSDRVGSLEVGKDADVAIFRGNPITDLQYTTAYTIINGEIAPSGIKQKVKTRRALWARLVFGWKEGTWTQIKGKEALVGRSTAGFSGAQAQQSQGTLSQMT